MLLLMKNLAFTVLVPGTVAVFVPVLVLAHGQAQPSVIAVKLWLVGEEPHLAGAFGPAYHRYCAAVARWLPTRRSSPQPPF
jgi:protein-S-isoprenylcysteine O-methyltransferase Ste14